jgi:small subunit ribosomal protein S6
MKNHYELIFIIKTSITDEERKKQIESVEKIIEKEGKIRSKEEMGKRTLAYNISGEKEGFYLIMKLELDGGKIKILNSKLNLENNLLRHMFVKE